MPSPDPSVDLNLLVALDALLAERSVTKAARRLGLSPSAMSRSLARLRAATADPLLVQAGRGMVPTPYAEALGARVQAVRREAVAVLQPAGHRLALATLDRSFTLRAGEGFVELLGAALMAAVEAAAPQVRLRFVPKPDWEAEPLREGRVDLEIGVLKTAAPEVRAQLLFRDRSVGIARHGHPLLAAGRVTPEAYAACRHVVASRTGGFTETVDGPLAALGLRRRVSLVVPWIPDAMRVVSRSELVSVVPRSCLGNARTADQVAALGLASFDLPVPTPAFTISAIWHPRMDADPAHRWLRETVLQVCRAAFP